MPNLISLEMRLSEHNAEEDISFLLRNNPALRRIHLHLAPSLAKKSASSGFKVLRHTLQREELPQRLNQVVVEGGEVANIHPAAFKVCLEIRVRLPYVGKQGDI